MLTYNNSDIVQCLRQYDMFANSLNLIKSNDEKNMIVKQLTKLEEKILGLTNDIYEEEYNTLANKKCELLADEKNRLTMLVELINQRLSYVEKRCNNHYQLTGDSIDACDVLGASQLDELENKVRIIDKYENNVRTEKELTNDIKSLSNKIDLASEKIDINKSLNVELESTFIKTLDEAFNKLNLYDLKDEKNDIEYAYYETEKSLTLAQLNYETAKDSNLDILVDCEEMLRDISSDYTKYKDQVNILKLMEVYDREVYDYEDLLAKRREVNDIIKGIRNDSLLELISPVVDKQFNTIMMEEQDVNTLNDLVLEKERKQEILSEIDDENNSEEFKNMLSELIENEKKRQEQLLEEQRRIEEEEKKRKQEIERKKQEEILKKQKIIEEARKKEVEKRTKQLLEEQKNSVLQSKKKENKVNFESIKDETLESKKEEVKIDTVEDVKNEEKHDEENKFKLDLDLFDRQDDEEEEKDEIVLSNKVDIEKELFDEFNSKKDENIELFDNKVEEEEKKSELLSKIEDKVSNNNNKFPDMSIDEYIKNFDENKVEKSDTLSDFDDSFPSIPI